MSRERLINKNENNNSREDYIITLLTTDSGNYTRYLIKEVRLYNQKRGVNNNLKKFQFIVENGSSFYPYVRLSLLMNKKSLLKDFLQCHTYTRDLFSEDKNFNIKFVYLPSVVI